MTRTLFAALPAAAVLVLGAVLRAEDPPAKVTFVEPKDGATVIRREIPVVVAIEGKVKSAAVVRQELDDKGKKKKAARPPTPVPLVQGDGGRYGAKVPARWDGKLELEARVEREDGAVETASVVVKADRSHVRSEMPGPGAKAPVATAKTTAGAEVAIDGSKEIVLVHFYSAWDECEPELKWLAGLAKLYPKLKIVGVASVTKADYAKWDEVLKKHGVTWTNVPDPDGEIAKLWWEGQHSVPGSQTFCSITYVLGEGKVLAADYMDWNAFGTFENSCESSLKRRFTR